MPDYGLSEALANAMKTLKGADFVRAPEAAAARQAAQRAAPAAVEAGAQAPAAPAVNPDMPDLAAPKTPQPDVQALGTPTPDGAVPAAQAAPPAAVGGGYDASNPAAPPRGNAVLQGTEGLPDISTAPKPKAGQSATAAAGTPPARPAVPPATPQSPLASTAGPDIQRFVTANISDFSGKLDMTHMPNVDNIVAPEGMKAAILQVADDNKDAITAARRGTIGDEQMLGLAQDVVANTDVLHTVLNRELGTQLERPEVVLAARMVGVNVVGEAQAAGIAAQESGLASADVLDYARKKQLFIDYQTQLQGGMAEQGRGTRAMGIDAPGTYPPEVMDHMAAVLRQNNPNLDQEVNALKMATTPTGIANIMHGSLPLRAAKATWSAINRVFINGILSGPPTWVKIFVGNNYNLMQNTFDLAAAGMVRGTIGLASRLGRFPASQEGAAMSDAFAYAHGVISSGADALRLAGRTMRTGVSLDNVMRFNPEETSGIKNVNPALGTTQSLLPETQDTYFGSIAKGMDAVIDFPGSRVIGSIDELTKTMGARGYRTMMVMKEITAKLKDGTLKPGDEGVVARDMFENADPGLLQAEEAWAHRMTFQTPFPEGGPGEAFTNLVSNHLPALKFIFPFMRTMTNILKQSLVERTPLAAFSSRIRAQLAGGGMERDLATGRIATGTAVGGMLAWMAVHDQITGDAPKNPNERAVWEADGRLPNSIKVTDPTTGKASWHPYGWFEPMATVATAVANIARIYSYVHQDNDIDAMPGYADKLNDAISHTMAGIITGVADKTLMTGAAKFSEMFADPAKGFQQWGQDFAASLVPYSKAQEFVRNIRDPYLREAFSITDKIENDFANSKSLGSRMDLFGNERKGRGILGPMSPFPGSPVGDDPVVDELHSLMDATHLVPMTMPERKVSLGANGKDILGGSGMRLTSNEYSDAVRYGRHDQIFEDGTMNLHDKLAQVMKTPTYMESTPAERIDQIKQYTNYADQIGYKTLYDNDKDFRDRLIATKDQAASIHRNTQ